MSPLSPCSLALQIGRLHRALLSKHPELRVGTIGKGRPKLEGQSDSFKSIAARTHNINQRTAAKYLGIYNALGEAMLCQLVNTSADKLLVLEKLKTMHPADRQCYVEKSAKRIKHPKLPRVTLHSF
jgi:hypothetical protein